MPFEINSPATVAQTFDKEVQLQFQNFQYLKNTVTERHNVIGAATNTPISSRLRMTEIGFAATNPPITPDAYSNVIILPRNFGLKTVVGGAESTLYNFDAVSSQATDHAMAAGRALDEVLIESIFDSALFNSITVIPKTVGATTGLNQAKMSAGLAALGDQGVDTRNMQVSMWAPFLTQPSLSQDTNVTSILYNDSRPLAMNEFPSYLGVSLRWLGSAGENIIPIQGSSGGTDTYYVPLVHKKAIQYNYNRDLKTATEWFPTYGRWELFSDFTANAGILQAVGIVFLECDVPSVAQP